MGTVLMLHNYMRWVLLAVAVLVVLKALAGWLGKQKFTGLDNQLGLVYTIVVDIQVLLGLILWLFGPTGLKLLTTGMGDPYVRFIALEHAILMLLALALAHMGRTRVKRLTSDLAKHRTSFIFYLLSLVFIVLIFVFQLMLME